MADGGFAKQQATSTVLVVDDVREAVDLIGELLVDRHDVRKAHNGEEALDRFDDDIDIVLLDRKMPGLSGYEVVEKIRERNEDVCIAMVSASEPDLDIVDVDFDEYLTKPLDIHELNETVGRLLDKLEYDDRQREYAATEAKLAVLEENKLQSTLDESDEYAALERRLRELKEDADSV